MKIENLLGSIDNAIGDEALDALLRHAREMTTKALTRIRRPEAAVGVVKSALGNLLIALSRNGVALTHYLHDASDLALVIANVRLQFDLVEDHQTVNPVGKEVSLYVAGDAKALQQKIDLTLIGTGFQKRVLAGLQMVPRGAVVSYQALGAAVGSAKAARAVGNALHNNPVPIYIPCHRVIATDGRLGGYVGGGVCKLQLLRSEGFTLDDETANITGATVWGHRGTKTYCRAACRVIVHEDRTQVIFFATPEQAQHAGLRPCKVCRPREMWN